MYLSLFQRPLAQGRHLLLLAGLCVCSTVNNGFVRTRVAESSDLKCLDSHQGAFGTPAIENLESFPCDFRKFINICEINELNFRRKSVKMIRLSGFRYFVYMRNLLTQ